MLLRARKACYAAGVPGRAPRPPVSAACQFVRDTRDDGGGLEDNGYTPKGKPAEAVLREWLAKPRWEVK